MNLKYDVSCFFVCVSDLDSLIQLCYQHHYGEPRVIACLEIENIVLDVAVPPLLQLRSCATAKERTTPEAFDNSQVEVSQPVCFSHSVSCKILIRARKIVACLNN